MKVKFHKIKSYPWDFQNFTYVFSILDKFDIHFLRLPLKFSLVVLQMTNITSLALAKHKKDCNIL